VLSDILLNSRFDAEEMEKEKKVVLEEINNMEDTPDDWVHELYAQNLYRGHSLGRPVLGSRKIVQNMTREDLAGYLAECYGAQRVVISAAGNVDHQALVDMVSRHFTFTPSGFKGNNDVAASAEARAVMYKKDILQSHVCLGAIGVPYNHPDRFDLLVLNTILGSGMSSRLFQNIREKTGMAYAVYSFLDFFHDTGSFTTYIGADPAKTRQAIKLILKEYADLVNNDLKADELEKCKSQLKGSLLLGLESTNNRMTHLARTEIYLDRFVGLDELIKAIDSVTAEGVRNIGGKILAEDRLCLTVLSPLEVGTVKVEDLKY